MSNNQHQIRTRVSREEYQLLMSLRERKPAFNPPQASRQMGDRLADRFAAIMGSWHFIIIQTIILITWVILNVIGYIHH